jgi:hypothetical protein
MTEIPVWMDQVAGGIAVVILLGGLLMMLTNTWTMK